MHDLADGLELWAPGIADLEEILFECPRRSWGAGNSQAFFTLKGAPGSSTNEHLHVPRAEIYTGSYNLSMMQI